MAAAHAWANNTLDQDGPAGQDEVLAEAREMGFDEEAIAGLTAMLARPAPGFEGVWPQHVNAVNAFLAGCTQWRTTLQVADGRFFTRWISLDYSALKVACDAFGIHLDAETMAGVRVMEMAASDALNGVTA